MRYLLFIAVFVFGMSSCEKYQECTIPIVGVYETHIVGVSGPFNLVISLESGDDIQIDAPWLEDIWVVVDADTDGCIDPNDEESDILHINIPTQDFEGGREIYGAGFYTDYTLQIDYTIVDGNDKYHYKMVGSKK